ncbi:DUF6597 domain-containing transcriptional factor [Paenibacillus sp. 1A_MP2]|uniref:DUF6597 domain-containing transcriptional factor n=1 Tax=Paenibacillus sp. 1A_MP2 TaxID=3457495 RepID=UPI003FCEAC62
MKRADHIARPSMGLLNLDEGDKSYRLTRYATSDALSSLVKHFWIVSWDLTGHDPYPQQVVPNPCVNLVVERGNTFFFGPSGQKFSYLVRGKGSVFGVKFKPGGFYPFIRTPVSTLYGTPLMSLVCLMWMLQSSNNVCSGTEVMRTKSVIWISFSVNTSLLLMIKPCWSARLYCRLSNNGIC